jgi:hypothetical protein
VVAGVSVEEAISVIAVAGVTDASDVRRGLAFYGRRLGGRTKYTGQPGLLWLDAPKEAHGHWAVTDGRRYIDPGTGTTYDSYPEFLVAMVELGWKLRWVFPVHR